MLKRPSTSSFSEEISYLCFNRRNRFHSIRPNRELSWDFVIDHFINDRDFIGALRLYQEQKHGSLCLASSTYISLLKACVDLKDLDAADEIYADITRIGLLTDVFICSTLVDIYAKCSSLAKSQEVFDMVPVQNVVIWNALITGYVHHEQGEKALVCFESMKIGGVIPDGVTYTCVLKACALTGALARGTQIHVEVSENRLLKTNIFVGNMLMDMYIKCGSLCQAKEIFEILPSRNVVTWTVLITAYTRHNCEQEALRCLKKMRFEGICPNRVTYMYSLRACGNVKAVREGCEIHAMIIIQGLDSDVIIGNALVDMYAKCGMLEEAHELLNKLHIQIPVTWTSVIAGYVQYGWSDEALNCLSHMRFLGILPNAMTFTFGLKACAALGALNKGMEIHSEIARRELFERNLSVGSALVDMYVKCGLLIKAQDVFDMLLIRDVVTWNALIGGYAQFVRGHEALRCFEQMQVEGVLPDCVMHLCMLKSCGAIEASVKGIQMHTKVLAAGVSTTDICVGSALIDMYAKCGMVAECRFVFDMIPFRNVMIWNALIGGYVDNGCTQDALNCYLLMQKEGITPDSVTFASILKACGHARSIEKGSQIHLDISDRMHLQTDRSIGNALVDMYTKCGSLTKAQEVFDMLPTRDEITWNILIAGYLQYERDQEALRCFEQMQHESIPLSAATVTSILKACGNIGSANVGEYVHGMITRLRLVQIDVICGGALIDMYSKCGLLAKAQDVFNLLPTRNIVIWNSLITGYSQFGKVESVLYKFNLMLEEGIEPDGVTFVGILGACSHRGLVDNALKYLEAMYTDYDIIPTLRHHTCIIDLFGRAGQINGMITMTKEVPFHPCPILWLAVLGSCRKWGNVDVGRKAFKQAASLNEDDAAAYVCMYNIYADLNMQELG